jgi:hypothetical protein
MLDLYDNIITAFLAITVMTIGMRLIYGYWPWQKRPIAVPKEKIADLKQDVEKVFREQLPPFSEADMINEKKPQPDSEEGVANPQADEKDTPNS